MVITHVLDTGGRDYNNKKSIWKKTILPIFGPTPRSRTGPISRLLGRNSKIPSMPLNKPPREVSMQNFSQIDSVVWSLGGCYRFQPLHIFNCGHFCNHQKSTQEIQDGIQGIHEILDGILSSIQGAELVNHQKMASHPRYRALIRQSLVPINVRD